MDSTSTGRDLHPLLIGSPERDGLILTVTAIGFDDPALTGSPWLRCTDGTTYRVPAYLHDWAVAAIAGEARHQQSTGRTLFPLRLRIAVQDKTLSLQVM
ncbi:hypothetical protein [Nocardia sp. NPDC051832]|uniref:hypothetical protein n=1 Tax=Nocardia sp. NPDC051832 TaxID=3155673 RepID=UPI0034344B99